MSAIVKDEQQDTLTQEQGVHQPNERICHLLLHPEVYKPGLIRRRRAIGLGKYTILEAQARLKRIQAHYIV